MAKTAEKSPKKSKKDDSLSLDVRLKISLPKNLVNRLEILSEPHQGDLARTIAEAVAVLWDARYSPSPASTSKYEEQKRQIIARHNTGVPLEDIARELDLSEEHVKEMLKVKSTRPEREVLKERAATLQALGVSLTGIAKQWNEEGVPTVSGQGKWHHSMVRKLLPR